jgi:hypothetical protein
VCRNCAFYAAGAYNDCREPCAERVVDKERANFCEFFQLGAPAHGRGPKAAARGEIASPGGGARDALDALFRKR